jgi:hypothetical protein
MQHNAGKLAEAKQGYTKLLEQYKPSAGVYVNYAILHESAPPIEPIDPQEHPTAPQRPATQPCPQSIVYCRRERTGRGRSVGVGVGRQYTIDSLVRSALELSHSSATVAREWSTHRSPMVHCPAARTTAALPCTLDWCDAMAHVCDRSVDRPLCAGTNERPARRQGAVLQSHRARSQERRGAGSICGNVPFIGIAV